MFLENVLFLIYHTDYFKLIRQTRVQIFIFGFLLWVFYYVFDFYFDRVGIWIQINVISGIFTGRYEDDFINERMRQLQFWIDRMCRHPTIAQSDCLQHFLTCTDDKVGIYESSFIFI